MGSRPAIFVTGAAAGIGRATAERFAAAGWFVGLYDVNGAGVDALRNAIGPGHCTAGPLDVTDAASFGRALAAFFAAAGNRLDVMFNNAGILSVGAFEDIPLTRHHALVDVNLKGVLNGALLSLPYLKQTPGARLINMGSASAIYGSPMFASYGATKFAVKGLTEALNIEWARHGVQVMDVLPLFVGTAMVTDMAAPPASLQRIGVHLDAADIARTVWKAAHSRRVTRVHWYPGLRTQLLVWINKLMPAWFNRWSTRVVSGF